MKLETERFILREILETDVDGLFELDSDSEVHKYLGGNPVTEKSQIVEVIKFIRQQYIDNGIGRWAIIDKKTNEFLGWSGLKFVTEEPVNNHINYYDIGYRIIRKHWNKGIGTETAIACLDYAFTVLNLKEVYASADCDNIASNKILQKIGLKLVETFYYEDQKRWNWYKLERSKFHKS